MTAIGPYSQSYDMRHMYSFNDLRPDKPPVQCLNTHSIMDILSQGLYKKFSKIVERARMNGQLNEKQANFTLFAVPDSFLTHVPEQYFNHMDIGTAKQILNSSLMNRVIDKELITSSPVSYYPSLNSRNRLYITNISGCTMINECSKVVGFNIAAGNGLIHHVDTLIRPTNNTFIN